MYLNLQLRIFSSLVLIQLKFGQTDTFLLLIAVGQKVYLRFSIVWPGAKNTSVFSLSTILAFRRIFEIKNFE